MTYKPKISKQDEIILRRNDWTNQLGLVDGINPSNYLLITNAQDLTEDRVLNVATGDSDRSLTLSGNLTVLTDSTISGNNTGDQNISITGDVRGSGTHDIELILTETGITPNTFFNRVKFDSKGRAIEGSNSSTLAGLGITDAQPLDGTLTAISGLTGPGAIVATSTDTFVMKPVGSGTSDSLMDRQSSDARYLKLTGGSINGTITVTGIPYNDNDVATKAYVDALKQGLLPKDPVRVLSSTNIEISNPPSSIDGTSLHPEDRVLLIGQNLAIENGIYVYHGSGSALTRSFDCNMSEKVKAGLYTWVEEGESYQDSGWTLVTDNPISLGNTDLKFTLFASASSVIAGNGLTKTGNQINIVSASSDRIVVNSDSIDLAQTGVIPGNYTKVNVDGYGRIKFGSTPSTLSELGITNAVENSGGIPSMLSGDTLNSAPSPGIVGRMYVTLDTLLWYRDNGTNWELVGNIPVHDGGNF